MHSGKPTNREGARKQRLSPGIVFLLLAGGLGLLALSAFAGWYSGRKPWVEPVPGVVLKPTRPILPKARVKPGSAPGFYLRAAAKVDARACTILDLSSAKLDFHPWPPPDAQLPPGDPKEAGIFEEAGAVPRKIWRRAIRKPWTAVEVENVRKAMADLSPAIKLARAAVAAPNPRIYSVTSFVEPLPDLRGTRKLVLSLAALARFKASMGKVGDAIDDLALALCFGDIPSHGGCLIQRSLSIGCTVIATKTQWRIARDHPETPDQLRRQMVLLTTLDKNRDPISDAFRFELVLVKDLVEHHLRKALSTEPGDHPAFQVWFFRLLGSTPGRMLRDMTAVYSHIIAAADQPYSRKRLKALDTLCSFKPSGWPGALFRFQDPLGILINAMVSAPATAVIRGETGRVALLRGMRVFLAVIGWEAEHGAPPRSLAQLVPEWLPAVPEDPFRPGHAFRYARHADGSWAVYSVGPDQEDDGGVGEFWGKARIAWPLPWRDEQAARSCRPPALPRGVSFGGKTGDIVFPSIPFSAWWAGAVEKREEHIQ